MPPKKEKKPKPRRVKRPFRKVIDWESRSKWAIPVQEIDEIPAENIEKDPLEAIVEPTQETSQISHKNEVEDEDEPVDWNEIDNEMNPRPATETTEGESQISIAETLAAGMHQGILPQFAIDIPDWMEESEIDLTMMANISKKLNYAIAYGIALETEYPCQARKWFMEMVIRGSRSVNGESLTMLHTILSYALNIPLEQGGGGDSRAAKMWSKFMGLVGRE
jgi:hypothetical protein